MRDKRIRYTSEISVKKMGRNMDFRIIEETEEWDKLTSWFINPVVNFAHSIVFAA